MKRKILNVVLLVAGISLFACGVQAVEKNYFFGIAGMLCAVLSIAFTIYKWRSNMRVEKVADMWHMFWLFYLDFVLLLQ